ncbi:G-protein coupled estrogen receptor 1-like [Heptranchias perlo]|uniref:G-protein coupled estrogen receptor 1-like n=1 Tax=Heptranchias perlo TaxID=212740 RepID=UPI00355A037B
MARQETPHNATHLSDYFNSTLSPSDNGNSTHVPSDFDNSAFIEIVKAQDLISRSIYAYSIFGLVGFITGIFIIVIYIGNYSKKRKFEKLDIFLFSLTLADLILILFSLTDIVRPEAVETTALGCAVLSFFFNTAYFYTEYIHIVISFFLAYDHIALIRKALNKPFISVLAAMGLSVLFSVLVTALTGAGRDPSKTVNCHVDPLEAPPEYGIVKFVFGFLMPTLIILGFILHFLIHSTCLRNSEDLQDCRERVQPHRVFLALVTVTFICRLVYNILLLLRPQTDAGSRRSSLKSELVVIIGELIMFAGSCLCLVSIVTLHEMRKDAAMETLRCITEPCRGVNANRNHDIMSPNIEIKEHHEETASLY